MKSQDNIIGVIDSLCAQSVSLIVFAEKFCEKTNKRRHSMISKSSKYAEVDSDEDDNDDDDDEPDSDKECEYYTITIYTHHFQ